MNLILLSQTDFIENEQRVRLNGRRFLHITKVLQASVGDELHVGVLNSKTGKARITRMEENLLEMNVRVDSDPPLPLPVTLILALPRPKVLKRVLMSASSMGVKKMVLLNTWRVEKSYWKSPRLKEEKMNEALMLGLEQARDTMMPEVLLRPLFKPFVEDELPELMKGTLPLLAHMEAGEPCPRHITQPVTLVVGPEGGFIPYEVEKLTAKGFKVVSLGERTLRVETAVPVLLSKIF